MRRKTLPSRSKAACARLKREAERERREEEARVSKAAKAAAKTAKEAAKAKRLAGAKTTGESNIAAERETWVCCDVPGCGMWRRVPGDVAGAVSVGGRWVCAEAPDPRFASCNAPQELSDDEIDRCIASAVGSPALGALTTNAAANAAADTNPESEKRKSGGWVEGESARAGGGRGTETAPRKRPPRNWPLARFGAVEPEEKADGG